MPHRHTAASSALRSTCMIRDRAHAPQTAHSAADGQTRAACTRASHTGQSNGAVTPVVACSLAVNEGMRHASSTEQAQLRLIPEWPSMGELVTALSPLAAMSLLRAMHMYECNIYFGVLISISCLRDQVSDGREHRCGLSLIFLRDGCALSTTTIARQELETELRAAYLCWLVR